MIYNAKTKDIIEYHPNQKYLNTLEKLPTNLFFSNVIGAPSATIFRSNIKIKFDKSLIWLVDIEFYTQLILRYKIHRLLDKLIITSSELESQLTSSLKDNKNIELFEFFYCYNKLRNLLDNQNKQVFLNVLFDTIDKYSIKSVNEIKAFEVKIIKNTLLYFYINIPSKFIKKVIRKLNNTF